jgi:phosphoribosyl 1,2-cyclic phosphodiesterase
MRIRVLASGSKGNCTCVDDGTTALLVDCGLSVKEALARLRAAGGDPGMVRAVLVTHEHADHIHGAAAMARRLGVPVYGTGGTLMDLAGAETGRKPVRLVRTDPGTQHEVNGFTVEAFATSHDAREPCGFTLTTGGIRFTSCTDTGLLSDPILRRLRVSDAILLESNHCPEMLRTGPYPEVLKRRIRSPRGHLSNRAAAACLRTMGCDAGTVILGHLSEINNTPEKALASAKEGLGLYCGSVRVVVGKQHQTSDAVEI